MAIRTPKMDVSLSTEFDALARNVTAVHLHTPDIAKSDQSFELQYSPDEIDGRRGVPDVAAGMWIYPGPAAPHAVPAGFPDGAAPTTFKSER